MSKNYNISGDDECIYYSTEELLEHYENNKMHLLKGYAYEDIPATVVANQHGYVTFVSDKGGIGQCWAGEFKIGL